MIPVSEIVESGLCIGCGLCESVAPESMRMHMDDRGVERPAGTGQLTDAQTSFINAVCPGLRVEVPPQDLEPDPMWGVVRRLARGHATDPAVRFRAAAGGVLSALGRFVLSHRHVKRVVHLAPDPEAPLFWKAQTSTSPEDIMSGAGSRYGPGAPLTSLTELLDDPTPMALIVKPCDAAGVRNVLETLGDEEDVVRYILVMACGGASRMTKSWKLVEDFGMKAEQVVSLRHRGYGNPGRTVVTSEDGTVGSTDYLSMWEDEGTWDLQWRCKVCPDGMGEVADLVGLDCWPGGAPVAEDHGFDGIIVRTERGETLLADAVEHGAIRIVDDHLPVDETLESWQPHQSRRRAAVSARLQAMSDEGLPTITTTGLRLDLAAQRLSPEVLAAERLGARERIQRGLNL